MLQQPNPGKPHTVWAAWTPETHIKGPLGLGVPSPNIGSNSPWVCGSPSPCRVSANMAKGTCLGMPPLNLDLLLDPLVRSGICPGRPTIFWGALQFLFNEIFTKARSVQTQGGGMGLKAWLCNLRVGRCLCAKFHLCGWNGMAAYTRQTSTFTR